MPNHLISEKSPYLQQHAHNPVDWYPWGEAAFEKARREDKPIFLSIGYSTCHWCHVMERESFENPAIAAILNRSFVPMKVDREERPDVDHIYMTYVQATTGSGGWPMSVFLTPEPHALLRWNLFPARQSLWPPRFPAGSGAHRRSLEKPARPNSRIQQQRDGAAHSFIPKPLAANGAALDKNTLDATFQYFRRTFDSRTTAALATLPNFPGPWSSISCCAIITAPDARKRSI